MASLVVTILVFSAAFLVILAINSVLTDLFPSNRKDIHNRLREEMREKHRTKAKDSPLFKDISQLLEDPFEEAQKAPTLIEKVRAFIEQSGIDWSVDRLAITGAVLGLVLGAVGLLLSGALAGGIALAGGFVAPLMYVRWKRNARIEKLLSQIPDSFDLMSRIIRAGQTITQAMQSVADEFEPPLAEEFGYCYEQQNLGLDAETALRDLARRTGLLELKIFVLAVLVHRQTGGNLAELLDKLSSIVRDRFRIRGLIRTLTAEGRVQAGVLLALPFVMYGAMLVFNRDYALILLDHPWVPIASLGSLGFGWLWIRKIINFDV